MTARRTWTLIRPYARQRRGQLTVLAVLLLAVTLLQVLNPQLVRGYIDEVAAGGRISVLVRAAVAYLAVAAVLQVLRIGAAYLGENVAWGMTNALRADLTGHCVHLDARFHQRHTPGELIERVDGDVTTLAQFLSSAFFVIVSNLLLVLGIFISLFVIDWRIGCVLLAYAVIALVTLLRIRGIALDAWTRVRQTSAEMFGSLGERVSSVDDVRTSGAEAYVLGRLDRQGEQLLRDQRTAQVRSNTVFTVMHGLYLFGYGGALAVGAVLYARGWASLGTVYLVIAYTNFIYLPLNEVRAQIQETQRASAGLKRVIELFDTAPAIADGPGVDLPAGALAVEVRDVSFRYGDDADWALREVSLRLAPGEVLGVSGRTGSGKTTLARLLARTDDPTTGQVLLAGHDLRQARGVDLRGHVGVITQDVQIFHGTVYDNVTMFDESVDRTRVEAAIADLGLADWLARLPDGVDTVLEAGAAALSAGEAQLLAICRIFLADPGLVILDEVSSRLDLETERRLERALTGLLAGRTGMVIGHRPATLARADRIAIFERGRIVESGPRDGLLADPESRLSRLVAAAREEALR